MSETKNVPQRIQRKRTKGWRAPPNTRYCGRPTMWGNPFVGEDAISRFQRWSGVPLSCDDPYTNWYLAVRGNLWRLRQYDYLSCWCPLDQPCHVDVLIELLKTDLPERWRDE